MLPSHTINIEDTEAIVKQGMFGRTQATISKIAGTYGRDYITLFNEEHELRIAFTLEPNGCYAMISVAKKLCQIKQGDYIRFTLEGGAALIIEFTTTTYVSGALRCVVAIIHPNQFLTLMENKIAYAEVRAKGALVRFDFKDCDQYGPASNGAKVVHVMLKRLTGVGKSFGS